MDQFAVVVIFIFTFLPTQSSLEKVKWNCLEPSILCARLTVDLAEGSKYKNNDVRMLQLQLQRIGWTFSKREMNSDIIL